MSVDDHLLADRRRVWRDFSRLLLWGPVHIAVLLIVVVMLAVHGPTTGTIVLGFILVGGNLAITAAVFLNSRW